MCCFSCWLSPPPLECSSWWRAEMNLSAWGCVWGTGRTGLQIFSGANFMSPILLSPYIQKNTKILHGDDCSSWLAKSAKRIVLDCMYSPFIKSYIYILTFPPPCLFGAISQNYLKCSLLDYCPHFAANKTLMLCVFFFKFSLQNSWSFHLLLGSLSSLPTTLMFCTTVLSPPLMFTVVLITLEKAKDSV